MSYVYCVNLKSGCVVYFLPRVFTMTYIAVRCTADYVQILWFYATLLQVPVQYETVPRLPLLLISISALNH